MIYEVNIPKLGMSMKDATIVEWNVSEGANVEQGSVVCIIETEKVTWEVEAVGSGYLHIVVKEGERALVGEVIGLIAETEEELQKAREGKAAGGSARSESDMEAAPPPAASAELSEKSPADKEEKFVPSSPAARRLAKELGVNLAEVTGTGPKGRITESDVKSYHEQSPPAARVTPLAAEMARQHGIDLSTIQGSGEGGKITREDVEQAISGKPVPENETVQEQTPATVIPYKGIRKTIGDNLHNSLLDTAQVNLFTEVDATEMVRLRDELRETYKADQTVRISYNDIIIKATSRALKDFPIMNSTLADDQIILHDSVHMGVAVAMKNGLIVPVLREADKKGILQIGREARELAQKARAGKLLPDDQVGGTFTVSNISMFGIDLSTPILKPPETGILGVGRVQEKPAVYKGEITIRWMMYLSLTLDHRIVDGAPAAEFLQTLARYLERPYLILS